MVMRAMGMFALVVATISVAFWLASTAALPHQQAQAAAALWGFASALTWGLSVVGNLIWTRLTFFSTAHWNSWFNLLAAVCAATAVGYATI